MRTGPGAGTGTGKGSWPLVLLLLQCLAGLAPLLAARAEPRAAEPQSALSDHAKDATDDEGRNFGSTTTPTVFTPLLPDSDTTDANRCDSSDDEDCKRGAMNNASVAASVSSPSKLRRPGAGAGLGGRSPGAPLEYGMIARSLSIAALGLADIASAEPPETNYNATLAPASHELKYRVFAQSWCSAANCPMALAATGSDISVGPALGPGGAQELSGGKGEAVLVSKGPTAFGAVVVSILERLGAYGVCSHAVSTVLPDIKCAVVCWHNTTCTCASMCNKPEVGGADYTYVYRYAVSPDTSIKDLLSYLHQLMLRLHAVTSRPPWGKSLPDINLNIPAKSSMVRERIEKRFGPEKAKTIPIITS